jgi:hypothetical protein
MTYSEKLKDPRWQKLRLEVMNRENFRCEDCGGGKLTLHVHHNYYAPGRNPWEYPTASLSCLCEACHKQRSADKFQNSEGEFVQEWEKAAVLQIGIGRVNQDCSVGFAFEILETGGFTSEEVASRLGRLGVKYANSGGLLQKLAKLENKGLL